MENHQWKLRWEGLGTSGKGGRIEAVPEWVSGVQFACDPMRSQPLPQKNRFYFEGWEALLTE